MSEAKSAAGLAPVALVPDLAATLGTPFTRDPNGSRTRGLGVAATDPDVATAIPAVIAGFPYPAAMWGRGNNLHRARWGRSYANYNLGIGDGRSQDDGSRFIAQRMASATSLMGGMAATSDFDGGAGKRISGPHMTSPLTMSPPASRNKR